MSNPILTTTNSKLDTRVKEPSGVVPPPSGVGSLDRFRYYVYNLTEITKTNNLPKKCFLL